MDMSLKRKLSVGGQQGVAKQRRMDDEIPHEIMVGSRKSPLAVIQTNSIVKRMKTVNPSIDFKVETMETLGDKILHIALPKIGEKSLFTKDLEIALEEKRVDFLVHSLKDLPTTLPQGMAISTIYKRDDPHDCVIFHPKYKGKTLAELPDQSIVGTSSLRRVAQLKRRYKHLQFKSVRGNLNTRLRKLEEESLYDAIVLAKAGIDRMGWSEKVGEILVEDCLYAIGQGAMAVETRADDKYINGLLAEISDLKTLLSCAAERCFMKTLNGGCSTPIGCYTKIENDVLSLRGVVLSADGSVCLDHTEKTPIRLDIPAPEDAEKNYKVSPSGLVIDELYMEELSKAENTGEKLAFALKGMGADDVLREVRAQLPNVSNIQVPTSSAALTL